MAWEMPLPKATRPAGVGVNDGLRARMRTRGCIPLDVRAPRGRRKRATVLIAIRKRVATTLPAKSRYTQPGTDPNLPGRERDRFGSSCPGEVLQAVEIIQGSPTVRAELVSRPDSVALIRAMLTGAVELLEFDRLLIDDLNTAVSEACNNVVMHAYEGAPGPLIVHLEVCADCVEVSIRDFGGGFREASASEDRLGTGIAVISALADRAEFFSAPGGGTEVRLAFSRKVGGDGPAWSSVRSDGPDGLPTDGPGEVLVSLYPMALLPGILGRMTRLLAARARFSLERFSDTYLLIDRLVAHAEIHATSAGISFGLCAHDSQLDLRIGPLQAESAPQKVSGDPGGQASSQLERLADEIAIKPIDDAQMLCMVVRDHGHA
jgi:serine/threonine-protein kinase RsbW